MHTVETITRARTRARTRVETSTGAGKGAKDVSLPSNNNIVAVKESGSSGSSSGSSGGDSGVGSSGDGTTMSSIFDGMKRDFADLIDEVELSCHDSYSSSSTNPSAGASAGALTSATTAVSTSGSGSGSGTTNSNGNRIHGGRLRDQRNTQSSRRPSSIITLLDKVFWRTRTVDDDI